MKIPIKASAVRLLSSVKMRQASGTFMAGRFLSSVLVAVGYLSELHRTVRILKSPGQPPRSIAFECGRWLTSSGGEGGGNFRKILLPFGRPARELRVAAECNLIYELLRQNVPSQFLCLL